jgi:hypothetical protein
MMRARCQGRDASPVESDDEVKSVSSEMSFAVSLSDRESISRALATMAAKVCRRLRKKQLKARTITLKLRYENLKVRTAQTRLDPPGADEFVMAQRLDALIDELWTQGMLVRLVGVAASGFGDDSSSPRQERLFELDADDGPAAPALRETLDARKRESLIDMLHGFFPVVCLAVMSDQLIVKHELPAQILSQLSLLHPVEKMALRSCVIAFCHIFIHLLYDSLLGNGLYLRRPAVRIPAQDTARFHIIFRL